MHPPSPRCLAAPAAHAANYYWDNNGTTLGLSTGARTSGTWNGATNASNTYAVIPSGIMNGTTGLVSGGTAATTSDSINFGTNNLSLGTTGSTIGTTGTISINNIVFGAGQGAQGVTLGSGGIINLGGTTPTVTSNNTIFTWVLRGVGALLMFIGFAAIFRPLSVIADVLPIAGDIVGVGSGLVALLLTVVISLSVIAFAWIFYRPLLGMPLAVIAVGGLVFLVVKLMAQRKNKRIA